MSSSFFDCSSCKALFRVKKDLDAHLRNSPRCQILKSSKVKDDPHAFTAELSTYGGHTYPATSFKTIPDTEVLRRDSKKTSSVYSGPYEDDTLLAAMEAGMKKVRIRKSGLETSILSAVAEGDDELATAYSKLSVDPATGKKKLSKDIVETATNKAKINVNRVAALISRAQNVSLCFVLDTTGSMAPYISGVKDQIVEIVGQIQVSGCRILGLAFVGYKDWCDGENHFEVLNFTTDIDTFKSFVTKITATGGGDAPEDVIGGLDRAIALTWPEKSGSRILFHLGDAPPHGKERYHSHADDYPNGHPRDKPLESLFADIKKKNLKYYFGRINNECDKMISVFDGHYGARIDTMDSSKASLICSSVTASVMSTVTATCIAVTSDTRLSGKMLRSYVLNEKEPDWPRLPQQEGVILTFHLPPSIDFITSFTKLEERIQKCKFQIAPNPFAKGSVRLAYYGKLFYPGKDSVLHDVVFKEMITLPTVADLDRQRYMANLEVQTVASKLALDFNSKLLKCTGEPNIKIKYLMAKVVRTYLEDGKPRFMAYEKRFRGATPEMIKYTNNLDFSINPETLDEEGRKRLAMAIAFSHFTYDVTGGYLLVCDLQGIVTTNSKGENILLLTDPAIHCPKHIRFGKTNLGVTGINRFFKKHVCNKYCSALGLKKLEEEDY